MRLNFTAKDFGHTDLVDESTEKASYTIRTSLDAKMRTIRKPGEPSSDERGLFLARFHFHTITADKVELEEGKQLKVQEWIHQDGRSRTFTATSGVMYTWTTQKQGDIKLEREGQEVAYLHNRNSGMLAGGEKRERACLEIDAGALKDVDDIVVSCLFIKVSEKRGGGVGDKIAVAISGAAASGIGVGG